MGRKSPAPLRRDIAVAAPRRCAAALIRFLYRKTRIAGRRRSSYYLRVPGRNDICLRKIVALEEQGLITLFRQGVRKAVREIEPSRVEALTKSKIGGPRSENHFRVHLDDSWLKFKHHVIQ